MRDKWSNLQCAYRMEVTMVNETTSEYYDMRLHAGGDSTTAYSRACDDGGGLKNFEHPMLKL